MYYTVNDEIRYNEILKIIRDVEVLKNFLDRDDYSYTFDQVLKLFLINEVIKNNKKIHSYFNEIL